LNNLKKKKKLVVVKLESLETFPGTKQRTKGTWMFDIVCQNFFFLENRERK